MSENGENGAAVKRTRVAVVTLTYDLEKFELTIGGSCPTLAFVKALCLMGADEAEWKIQQRRAAVALSMAPPGFLESIKGR